MISPTYADSRAGGRAAGIRRGTITDFEKVVSCGPYEVSSFCFSPRCQRRVAPWPKIRSEHAWVHLSTEKVILIVNCPDFGQLLESQTQKSIDTCGGIYK